MKIYQNLLCLFMSIVFTASINAQGSTTVDKDKEIEIENRLEGLANKYKALFTEDMNLKQITQIIAEQGLNEEAIEQKLSLFTNTISLSAEGIKSANLNLSTSMYDWKPKVGNWKDYLKFYPFTIKGHFGAQFSETAEKSLSELSIKGAKLNFAFGTGLSVQALDNFGWSLIAGGLGLHVNMDSLTFIKKVLASPNLTEACTPDSIEKILAEMSQETEEFSIEDLKKSVITICDISNDVKEATNFVKLVTTTKPKFDLLEEQLDEVLTESATALGKGLVEIIESKLLGSVVGGAFSGLAKILTSHSFKANDCSEFYKKWKIYEAFVGTCKPSISVFIEAQPLVAEGTVGVAITENTAAIVTTAEVVPYAANFFEDNSQEELYKYVFIFLKTIETMSDEDIAYIGERSANEFQDLIKSLSTIVDEEIDPVDSPEELPDHIDQLN